MSGRTIVKSSSGSFRFTTRQFSDGVPTTLAGTPVVSVYEEANITQTTTGVTLTVDYDGVTGLNDVVVSTSDAFYEAGKTYDLVITTGTVGGTSVVGEVVGTFKCVTEDCATPSDIDQALIDIGLDHLVFNSVTGTDITDNSIIAQLVSISGDWDTFDNSTDSLEAISNTLSSMSGATFNTTTDSLEAISNAISTQLPDVLSLTNINTEVVSAIEGIIIPEPTGKPSATPTLPNCLGVIFNPYRNRIVVENTGGENFIKRFYVDSGAQIYSKSGSNDGTVYDENEMV